MPKVPPPKETQWVKGQSGNPSGKAPDSPEVKKLKNLTKAELVEIGNLIIKCKVDTLRRIATSGEASALRAMIASVAVKAIDDGDDKKLETLLNRIIGKVRDELHHSGDINPPQIHITLPDNGRKNK